MDPPGLGRVLAGAWLGLACMLLPCSAAALEFTVLGRGGGNIIFASGSFERGDAARLSASDWKMSATRSFVVRLVRDGIAMMNGDYRKLLRIR